MSAAARTVWYMQIKGAVIGAGSVIALGTGVFAAALIANANDDTEPAPVVSVTPTETVESTPTPVVTETPAPEPVAEQPAPAEPAPPAQEAPVTEPTDPTGPTDGLRGSGGEEADPIPAPANDAGDAGGELPPPPVLVPGPEVTFSSEG